MSTRRRAFDPSRLEDLDDLAAAPPPMPAIPLASPTPAQERTPAPERAAVGSTTVTAPPASPPVPPRQAPAPSPVRKPRGVGGRPSTRSESASRAPADPSIRVAVPVRVSPELYNDVNQDLLGGPERPSYGQLVLWSCQDHTEDVVAAVETARSRVDARRPRGHRLAAADVQITLRMSAAERAYIDDIAARAPAPDGTPATRTELAMAALRVALQRADEHR